jgi:phytoene dehydrogenase-like protein
LTEKYDHIVAGSGISGLTMTLLLAMSGRRVLLLEKGSQIGGSLCRFSRGGTRFDTGFHFTGGLNEGGILADILSMLQMRHLVEPVFITDSAENRFIFEASGRSFELPMGLEKVKSRFKQYFPEEAEPIERYFAMIESVCRRTPSMKILDNLIAPPELDEDFQSLDEVLKSLTANQLLRGLLSGYAMCYGVRPDEISFANHCRMVQNFYESIAFVKGGGDGFIDAFRERFKSLDIDIRTSTYITELADIKESVVQRFILNSGVAIEAESAVLTMHPAEILKLFPEKTCSRAFASRINAYEPAAGFFSVFARIKPGYADPEPEMAIVSLFPDDDVNNLLDPAYPGLPALVMIKSPEPSAAGAGKGICILEPSFTAQVADWSVSTIGKRPEEYRVYKQRRIAAITEHIYRQFPAYRDCLEILDAGSMLTYRDYLHNHDGSAYGIKQKIRQFNLVGRLPLHNLYAAGQSSLLPGIIGSMMSSLIVGRSILGREEYGKLLGGSGCS